jgi:hypothetical protein
LSYVQWDCGENSQVISGWVFLNDWGEERSQQSCGFKYDGYVKKGPLLRRTFVIKSIYALVLQTDFITCFSVWIFFRDQQIGVALSKLNFSGLSQQGFIVV